MKRLARWWVLVTLALLALTWAARAVVFSADLPACVPTTTTHQRQQMKTRTQPASFQATPVTVPAMIAWDVPELYVANANVPVTLRERNVYALTGYVRLVKLSADDCDVHLQLGETADDPKAPQVIAEIPPTQPAARQQLADILGFVPSKTASQLSGALSPCVVVTGYGFLDASHMTHHPFRKEGHAHGTAAVATLYEIHPAWKVARCP